MTLRPVLPILACCISSHRSLPSRVRSPTPANTEEPPWAEAMRAISSCRMTVLPSPAPPNKPGLAAADEGRQQVDDLDARLEDFRLRGEVDDRRGVAVDGPVLFGVDGAALVDRLAQQVEDASQRGLAHRHADRGAGIGAGHAADHAVGAAQGDAADAAAAKLGLDLAGEADLHALLLGLDCARRYRSAADGPRGTPRRRSSR